LNQQQKGRAVQPRGGTHRKTALELKHPQQANSFAGDLRDYEGIVVCSIHAISMERIDDIVTGCKSFGKFLANFWQIFGKKR
jgi:hypothetical protein